MGRAPNSAVPQRVSAHVVAKPPSFVAEDEDDKTMIESGWEDEPSTTVEQGEVAEKLRQLGLGEAGKRAGSAPVVTDNSPTTEEPTIDDQRASAALALLPAPMTARLIVTQGNDAGQALEVRVGKTYTIGRGVDNDLVLSDLAVSRKHFDIRNDDNGGWLLTDRRSGNGTLVNTQIEDAPFLLANGDVIEIGNTAFCFELPNGTPRARRGYTTAEDDGELSTTPGAPLRVPQTPLPFVPGGADTPIAAPPPVATRPATHRPLPGMTAERPAAQAPNALAAPPAASPAPPARSGLAVPVPGGVATHAQSTLPLLPMNRGQNAQLPTLRGQGPAVAPSQSARLPFVPAHPLDPISVKSTAGPRGSTATPKPGGRNGPDPTSTAVVHPISYSGRAPEPVTPPPSALPSLPRSTARLLAAGAAIVLCGVAAAFLFTRAADPEPGEAVPAPAASERTPQAAAPIRRTIEDLRPVEPPAPPIEPPAPSVARPAAAAAPVGAPTKVTPPVTKPVAPPVTKPVAPPPAKLAAPPVTRAVAPPPAKLERIETAPAAKLVDKRPVKRAPEPARTDRKRGTRSVQDVRLEASVPYRGRNFAAAAALVTAALPSFTGGDIQDLKSLAASYTQFGNAFNVGMAPGTKPTVAYVQLSRARMLDRDLGAAYLPEIEQRLVVVASRAASSYMATKEYESAFQAVRLSDSLGSQSSTNKMVRDALESAAAELLRAATAERASDPDGAKTKARQVQAMVEPKSPLFARALKLLNGS